MDTPTTARRVLILGGASSGKSAEAERRLADAGPVTYVATGASRDGDAEWAARVAAHRARRPAHWQTVETTDLVPLLRRRAAGPLLVDCLGGWLTAVMDDCGAWDDDAWRSGPVVGAVAARVDDLISAWRDTTAHVVAVSNEVGMSVVPETTAGRRFRDALGRLNMRLAEDADEVLLVVAGRVLAL